jgi:hypothetical protein
MINLSRVDPGQGFVQNEACIIKRKSLGDLNICQQKLVLKWIYFK